MEFFFLNQNCFKINKERERGKKKKKNLQQNQVERWAWSSLLKIPREESPEKTKV